MSTQTTTTGAAAAEGTATTDGTATTEGTSTEGTATGAAGSGAAATDDDGLGEKGKKALQAERSRADAAETKLRGFEEAAEEARRKALSDQERAHEDAVKTAVAAAVTEVEAKFADQIKVLQVQVKAADRFVDPALVASLIDVKVDATDAEITAALEAVATARPYLLKDATKASITQGPRGGGGQASMDDQFREALRAGRG